MGGESRVRMDARMGAVWAEHNRVRRHRDLMVEVVRRRKGIAREQEATIQRLAAERAELREEVKQWERVAEGVIAWPCDGNGTHIRMGDRVAYMGSVGYVDGIGYELRTRDWEPQGHEWWVRVGYRDASGNVRPGHFRARPDQVEVLPCEPTVIDVLTDMLEEWNEDEDASPYELSRKYAPRLRLAGDGE